MSFKSNGKVNNCENYSLSADKTNTKANLCKVIQTPIGLVAFLVQVNFRRLVERSVIVTKR